MSDDDVRAELAALKIELAKIQGQLVQQRVGLEEKLIRAQSMVWRKFLANDLLGSGGDHQAPPRTLPHLLSFEQQMQTLRARVPEAFDHWYRLMMEGADVYDGFPVHSCSVDGHVVSPKFADFILPYLEGNVLDIGCGIQPTPQYLKGYPTEKTFGIDPLGDSKDHPCEFYRSVAEFLPWADDSFGVVVAATSLDHVLLLDQALDEVARVLRPGGWFLLWVYFTPGAEEYDPFREGIEPIDEYHLFHFDQPWFEQKLNYKFSLGDSHHLMRNGYFADSFYAYQVR